MTNLFEYLVAYLEDHGWRFAAPRGAVDRDKRTGSWWTRDEFAGWWQDPRTKEISDRHVDLQRALREQIEMEQHGVESVKDLIHAQSRRVRRDRQGGA